VKGEIMKLFSHTSFGGHYPVGVAAVVVAEDKKQAKSLLEADLKMAGLPQEISEDDLDEIGLESPKSIILNDGNY
jgi:hypothetical protein